MTHAAPIIEEAILAGDGLAGAARVSLKLCSFKNAHLHVQTGRCGGTVLYTNSTHLKANANKNKFDRVTVSQTPVDYLADLERDLDVLRAEQGKSWPIFPLRTERGSSVADLRYATRKAQQTSGVSCDDSSLGNAV